MRGTKTDLYLHLVWGTWDRLPLLLPDYESRVYGCIQAECQHLKCELIAVGGIEDHIHVLVRMAPTVSVADLVKQLKGVSSHLVNHRLAPNGTFKWQGAYGAFTISASDVPRLTNYIYRQKEHHKDKTLFSEYEFEFESA